MTVTDVNTKSTKAYLLLKEKLRKGDFPCGGRLTETGVAKALSMSRAPVREALLRLEAEGLIRGNGAYGGKFVAYVEDLEPEQALQRYELREMIEGLAARLAAKNMNGWQIDELRRLNDGIVEAFRAQDHEGRLKAAARFHQYLMSNCGNPLVAQVWESHQLMPLFQRSQDVEDMINANVPEADRLKDREEGCKAVVDAIAAHDPDEAERAAREVVRRPMEAIRITTWNRSHM